MKEIAEAWVAVGVVAGMAVLVGDWMAWRRPGWAHALGMLSLVVAAVGGVAWGTAASVGGGEGELAIYVGRAHGEWVAVAVWVAGVMAMVWQTAALWRIERNVRAFCRPASGATLNLCADIAREMGARDVRFWDGSDARLPFAAGLLSGSVWLRCGCADAGIVRHEVAHVMRRDPLWNAVARCAVSLMWCQPMAWVLVRRVRRWAEWRCDDWAVRGRGSEGRRELARSLVEALEDRGRSMPLAAAWLGRRGEAERRILRLVGKTEPMSGRAGAVWCSAAAVIIAGWWGIEWTPNHGGTTSADMTATMRWDGSIELSTNALTAAVAVQWPEGRHAIVVGEGAAEVLWQEEGWVHEAEGALRGADETGARGMVVRLMPHSRVRLEPSWGARCVWRSVEGEEGVGEQRLMLGRWL